MDEAERLQELIEGCVTPPTSFTPTIKECREILDELDKPELDPQHREILQSLMDEKGNVTKIAGKWRFLPIGPGGLCLTAHTPDELITDMIDLGLLGYLDRVSMPHTAGMTEYAYVTKAGIEALKR